MVLSKIRKTCQLEALIRQRGRTLGIFCYSRALVKRFSKHPLTFVKTIVLTLFVDVQSSGILKILGKSNIFKISEVWTATKCAKLIVLTKVRGGLKTSWRGLLNGVKQRIPTFFYDCVPKAWSSPVFPILGRTLGWGGPYGPPKMKKNIFSNL